MTETDWGSKDANDWPNNTYTFAKAIFTALKYGKVSAWLYWGMGTFYKSGAPTKYLYTGMQFFRFIRPGYKMVEVTETDPDVVAAGFKNGNNYTVVVINNNATKEKTVTFNDFTNKPAFFHVYRSSALESCSYLGKITNNQFPLPALSVVTLTYDASSPDKVFGAAPPTNLATTSVTDNAITVSWTPASSWTLGSSTVSISGYIVYIDGVKKTPDGPTTKTNWTFTGLKAGSTHTIEIYTRDAMMGQSAAAKLVVTTTCTVGGCVPDSISIADNTASLLSISPNPASTEVKIELPDDMISSISIIDMTGTVRIERAVAAVASETINISSLAKGVYIVVATGKKQLYKAKLIVE